LTEGFGTPRNAAFAAPDVLRWKYLEPIGDREPVPRSHVAREGETGPIVGHIGICPTAFRGVRLPGGEVSTMHIIDWLGSRAHRSVGSSLMWHVFPTAATQYGLIANARSRRVVKAAGYEGIAQVPVYRKVLRAGGLVGQSGQGAAGRLLRAGRDVARAVLNPGHTPRVQLKLCRVDTLGSEIVPILEANEQYSILTGRDPGLLAHALTYPRPGMSAWHILRTDRLVGFGLLNLTGERESPTGKIVECLMEGRDVDLWHAAVAALTANLRAEGAAVAVGFGSSPWMANALKHCGFVEAHHIEFILRDRSGLIPRDATFHLSPFEADYAYADPE
jgi:hypothetical protein